jgi:hypothetical protein
LTRRPGGPASGPNDYHQYKEAKKKLDEWKDRRTSFPKVTSGGTSFPKVTSGGTSFKKILCIILGIIVFIIVLGILSNS